MPAFLSVTPMIPTGGGGLAEALAYWVEALGFTLDWETVGMAGIRRGSVAFNLVVNDDRRWAENASFSIGVADLDALREEYRSANLPVGPLEVKPWGRREFHLIAPSGVCLQFFGEDATRQSGPPESAPPARLPLPAASGSGSGHSPGRR